MFYKPVKVSSPETTDTNKENQIKVYSGEYLVTDELLAEAKQVKTEEINNSKETAFKAGFYFNNAHFDCDDRAQIRLSAQLAISKQEDTIVWLDYDYNPVTLTYEQFVQMCAVATSIVSNIEFETSELLAAVDNAQSIAELELLTVNYNAVVAQAEQYTESEDTNE